MFLVACNALLLQLVPREFKPGLERDLEIHDCQERVDTVLLLDQVVDDVVVRNVDLVLVLDGPRHQVDAVLGPQLEDLHLLINFHVAVLPLHAPI